MNPNEIIVALLNVAVEADKILAMAPGTTLAPDGLDAALAVLHAIPSDNPYDNGSTRARRAMESFTTGVQEDEKEECKFCGLTMESPCESPPPDICSKGTVNSVADNLEAQLRTVVAERDRLREYIIGANVPDNGKEIRSALIPYLRQNGHGDALHVYDKAGIEDYVTRICVRYDRAFLALTQAGWTDLGGEEWLPPLRDLPAMEQQAKAWQAVAGALDVIDPRWLARTPIGQDSAVQSITEMAANLKEFPALVRKLDAEKENLLTMVADLATDGRRFRTLVWLIDMMSNPLLAEKKALTSVTLMEAMSPVGVEQFRVALDTIARNDLVPNLTPTVDSGLDNAVLRHNSVAMSIYINTHYRRESAHFSYCGHCGHVLPVDALIEPHEPNCIVLAARAIIENFGE